MHFMKAILAGVAACSVLLTPSVASADEVVRNAENIRKLDIMLMVTSLRCRTGAHNFQADYRNFSAAHLPTLNRAAGHLQSNLRHRHGTRGAKRALDKISVGMANQYGRGHPWLECAELKQITRDLASDRDHVRLSLAATDLLHSRPRGTWAALARQ